MNDQDCFAYLDNPTSQSHLDSCPSCRETVELLRDVDSTLRFSGASLRASVTINNELISAAKEKALARLGNHSLSLRLGSLYLLLAPMCGMETSTRAICAAAHRVSADSPRLLEEGAWPGFVEHLHNIVATLCGEPAAQLVRERGLSLQQEAA